jgi:hypothetical protein
MEDNGVYNIQLWSPFKFCALRHSQPAFIILMVMKLVSVHFVHNVHEGKGGGRVVGTFLDITYMI